MSEWTSQKNFLQFIEEDKEEEKMEDRMRMTGHAEWRRTRFLWQLRLHRLQRQEREASVMKQIHCPESTHLMLATDTTERETGRGGGYARCSSFIGKIHLLINCNKL